MMGMTPDELSLSAANDSEAPEDLPLTLAALWEAKAGNWHAAHDLCQEVKGSAGQWIHAHLHRQEGDLMNAGYWYRLAGKGMPDRSVSIEEEWFDLAKALS